METYYAFQVGEVEGIGRQTSKKGKKAKRLSLKASPSSPILRRVLSATGFAKQETISADEVSFTAKKTKGMMAARLLNFYEVFGADFRLDGFLHGKNGHYESSVDKKH